MIKGSTNAIDYREHDLTKQARRVIQTDPFGGLLTEGNYTVLIEKLEGTTYVGKAQIGSTPEQGVWQIMRVVEDETTSITWAGGVDSFNKVWDDRGSYDYS
jgi:hypothetical protein